ncbi:MAG: peptidylprolyl isomerase [Hyphomonas sp.]
MNRALALTALALAACSSAPASLAGAPPESATPEAPGWRPVDPENLLLLNVATGTVAIELFPEAAPAHVAQLRRLVQAEFYDGEFFYRVIDGHVAQAGREFDQRLTDVPTLPFEAERSVSTDGFTPLGNADLFAPQAGHRSGFAVGRDGAQEWLLNCPGAFGMARDQDPASGSSEIFIPLQPRRYLDRNYTIFGRVIDGMEHIHRLPRIDPFTDEETAILFGKDEALAGRMEQDRRTRLAGNSILSVRLAAAIPQAARPVYEVMDTASADWAALKDARRDYSAIPAFISPPPKRFDICSLPVPARRAAPVQP